MTCNVRTVSSTKGCQITVPQSSGVQPLSNSINIIRDDQVLCARRYSFNASPGERVACEQTYRVLSCAGKWTDNTSMARKAWRSLLAQTIRTSAYTFLLLLLFVLPLYPQAFYHNYFLRTTSSTEHDSYCQRIAFSSSKVRIHCHHKLEVFIGLNISSGLDICLGSSYI
jgi:hypothetical protein